MQPDRAKLLLIAMLTEGLVFGIAVALAGWRGITLYPRDERLVFHLLISALWTIPPLCIFLFLMSRRAAAIRVFNRLRRRVVHDIRPLFMALGVGDLVLIALMAGIAEESLFRGVLQEEFGIVAASVIFGLLHFVTPLYAVIATVMGLYLGALYASYGSLVVPIQIHFLYDLGALFYLRYGKFPENAAW